MKITVVSSYPEKGAVHSSRIVGVASYTKNLITNIKKLYPSSQITVLSEFFETKGIYHENGIDVYQMWKRNALNSIVDVYSYLASKQEDAIVLSFEAYMFGNPLTTAMYLFAFLLLSLSGKKITTILHQVVGDNDNVENGRVQNLMLKIKKSFVYGLINLFSRKIIVFEKHLTNNLDVGRNKKAVFVPHYVEDLPHIGKNQAKKKLGWKRNKIYVMCFGFVSPYKGIDRLIEAWKKDNDMKLVIAGGINPNHSMNKYHTDYYDKIVSGAKAKKIISTGFIKEKRLPLYFAAADIIILPYRAFISSSGPLSFALAYEKPFILSTELESYFKSNDFARAFAQAHIDKKDILWESSEDLMRKLKKVAKMEKKFISVFPVIKRDRAIAAISRRIYNEL